MIPVLIGWIIGVPLDIWWPRKVAPEHQGLARAYSAIRVTSILLALELRVVLRGRNPHGVARADRLAGRARHGHGRHGIHALAPGHLCHRAGRPTPLDGGLRSLWGSLAGCRSGVVQLLHASRLPAARISGTILVLGVHGGQRGAGSSGAGAGAGTVHHGEATHRVGGHRRFPPWPAAASTPAGIEIAYLALRAADDGPWVARSRGTPASRASRGASRANGTMRMAEGCSTACSGGRLSMPRGQR